MRHKQDRRGQQGLIINYTWTIKLLLRRIPIGKPTLAWKSRLLGCTCRAALHSDLSTCFLPLPTEQKGFVSCLPNKWSRPGFRSLLNSGEILSQPYYLATEDLNTQPQLWAISQGLWTAFTLSLSLSPQQHVEIDASKAWVCIQYIGCVSPQFSWEIHEILPEQVLEPDFLTYTERTVVRPRFNCIMNKGKVINRKRHTR